MQITYAVKDWFLDRAAVAAKIGKARQRAMLKGGSYTRRKARDLLRRGKKAAQPGRPPHVHGPEPNLKTIFFAYDPARDQVIVGPVVLNSSKARGGKTVPQIQEFGGVADIMEWSTDGGQTWQNQDQIVQARNRGKRAITRRRLANVAPHPFMQPAWEAAWPQIPEQFRDLI